VGQVEAGMAEKKTRAWEERVIPHADLNRRKSLSTVLPSLILCPLYSVLFTEQSVQTQLTEEFFHRSACEKRKLGREIGTVPPICFGKDMSTKPGEAQPPGDGVQPSGDQARTYHVTVAVRLRRLGPTIYGRGMFMGHWIMVSSLRKLVRGLT